MVFSRDGQLKRLVGPWEKFLRGVHRVPPGDDLTPARPFFTIPILSAVPFGAAWETEAFVL
jgi:hypothetical protein